MFDLTSLATIDDIVQHFRMNGDGRTNPGGMKFATGCMRVALLSQVIRCLYVCRDNHIDRTVL